jgi:DNA repair protein RecO (recombination protein O)
MAASARIQSRTEAIVLRLLDYGESDRIVTFCTPDHGKLRGIAKGARRSRRRFVNTLEPFCCSRILFSRRNPDSLALIEEAEAIDHFPAIRADLERTLAASYLIDLTDHFLPEDKKSPEVFHLLQAFLRLFEAEASPSEALLRFFELRLLKLVGYDPRLDRCLCCRQPVGDAPAYRFRAVDGGLTCPSCGAAAPGAVDVSLGTVRTLLMAREMAIESLGRLLLSPQSAEESRRLLAHFIRHLLGKEPKSLHVLNEIRRLRL